jgi:type VI secretion system protein VasJ
MDFDNFITKCLAPINGDQPAGKDCSNLEMYAPFKAEISKITGGQSREGVDWDKLTETCAILLSQHTKDIGVASYLSISLYKKFGYNGFLAGIKILVGIINSFPNYYPIKKTDKKTAKSRKIAINSFSNTSSVFLGADSGMSSDAESFHNIREQLQELSKKLEEISIPPPSINELLNTIGSMCEKYPFQPKEEIDTSEDNQKDEVGRIESRPETVTKDLIQKKPPKKKTQIPTQPSETQTQVSTDINQYEKTLIAISNGLRLANAKDPVPYRMKRFAIWDSKAKLPESSNELKTNIPFSREMATIRDLMKQEPNEAIIERLESNVELMVWWLDLQRMILQTMEKMGSNFNAPYLAICQELKYLLKRFPDLPGLQFKNGEEFANPETRKWLDEISRESDGEDFEFPSYLIDPNLQDDLKKAEGLANENELSQALNLIQDGMSASKGMKDIFCRKLAAGRFCMKHKRIKESLIIFENLFQQGKQFSLVQWDPLLFLELCQNYYAAIELGPDEMPEDIKNKVAAEILKLNMSFKIK